MSVRSLEFGITPKPVEWLISVSMLFSTEGKKLQELFHFSKTNISSTKVLVLWPMCFRKPLWIASRVLQPLGTIDILQPVKMSALISSLSKPCCTTDRCRWRTTETSSTAPSFAENCKPRVRFFKVLTTQRFYSIWFRETRAMILWNV